MIGFWVCCFGEFDNHVKLRTLSSATFCSSKIAFFQHRLMSLLMIVTTLARSSTASMGLIRDYLHRMLANENREMSEDRLIARKYIAESKKIRESNGTLRSVAVTFQNSKCSACSYPLELPSLHFLCQHCFHQVCTKVFSTTDSYVSLRDWTRKSLTEIGCFSACFNSFHVYTL